MFAEDHFVHFGRRKGRQTRPDGDCVTMLHGGHQDKRPHSLLLARSRRLHILPSDGMDLAPPIYFFQILAKIPFSQTLKLVILSHIIFKIAESLQYRSQPWRSVELSISIFVFGTNWLSPELAASGGERSTLPLPVGIYNRKQCVVH